MSCPDLQQQPADKTDILVDPGQQVLAQSTSCIACTSCSVNLPLPFSPPLPFCRCATKLSETVIALAHQARRACIEASTQHSRQENACCRCAGSAMTAWYDHRRLALTMVVMRTHNTSSGQAATGTRFAAHPLALEEGLAVLVNLQLGDDHFGGVQANVHRGAIHLQQDWGRMRAHSQKDQLFKMSESSCAVHVDDINQSGFTLHTCRCMQECSAFGLT